MEIAMKPWKSTWTIQLCDCTILFTSSSLMNIG